MAQEKHAIESGGSSSHFQSRSGDDAGGDGADEYLLHNESRSNQRDHSLHNRDMKGGDGQGGGSKEGSVSGDTPTHTHSVNALLIM